MSKLPGPGLFWCSPFHTSKCRHLAKAVCQYPLQWLKRKTTTAVTAGRANRCHMTFHKIILLDTVLRENSANSFTCNTRMKNQNTRDGEKRKRPREAFFFSADSTRWRVDIHVGEGRRGSIKVHCLFFCPWTKCPRWAGCVGCILQPAGHRSIQQGSSASSPSSTRPVKTWSEIRLCRDLLLYSISLLFYK